jgi:hypothetical protein
LIPKNSSEARKAIIQLVAHRQLTLIRLNQEEKNMESLFREITQSP